MIKEEKEENKTTKQKTFLKSLGGQTSGPLDKCFSKKDKKIKR